MLDDDYEHVLCEWVNRLTWRTGSGDAFLTTGCLALSNFTTSFQSNSSETDATESTHAALQSNHRKRRVRTREQALQSNSSGYACVVAVSMTQVANSNHSACTSRQGNGRSVYKCQTFQSYAPFL